MKLDIAQVQKVAKLANLRLTPEEEEIYYDLLDKIKANNNLEEIWEAYVYNLYAIIKRKDSSHEK